MTVVSTCSSELVASIDAVINLVSERPRGVGLQGRGLKLLGTYEYDWQGCGRFTTYSVDLRVCVVNDSNTAEKHTWAASQLTCRRWKRKYWPPHLSHFPASRTVAEVRGGVVRYVQEPGRQNMHVRSSGRAGQDEHNLKWTRSRPESPPRSFWRTLVLTFPSSVGINPACPARPADGSQLRTILV